MRGLLAERDADGKQVFRAVYKAKDIYNGNQWQEKADLYVGFQYGYRISWQATLGAMGLTTGASGMKEFASPLGDNELKWSGDHCSVDPSYVTGVFFSDRRLSVDPADADYEKRPSPVNEVLAFPNDGSGPPGLGFHDRNDTGRFSVLHIAPTLLDFVGLGTPPHMDRKALKIQRP